MEKLRAKLAALKAEALHWREKRAQQELADKKIQEELTAQRLAAWHVKHNQNVSAPWCSPATLDVERLAEHQRKRKRLFFTIKWRMKRRCPQWWGDMRYIGWLI